MFAIVNNSTRIVNGFLMVALTFADVDTDDIIVGTAYMRMGNMYEKRSQIIM